MVQLGHDMPGSDLVEDAQLDILGVRQLRDLVRHCPWASTLGSDAVDRAAMRQHEQPRPQRAPARIEGSAVPPVVAQRLLGDLFRQLGRTGDPPGQEQARPSVSVVDALERCGGAVADLGRPARILLITPGQLRDVRLLPARLGGQRGAGWCLAGL